METELRARREEESPADSASGRTLEGVYDALGAKLYQYLLSILRSEEAAQDVLQELFLRLARHSERLACAQNLTGYVFAAARNEARRFLDTERKFRDPVDGLRRVELVVPPREPAEAEEAARRLNAALSRLPPEQLEVVLMKVYSDLTFAEIAGVVGEPLDTVASRYRYALEKLRKWLSEPRGNV